MRFLKINAASKFSRPIIQGNVWRFVCEYFSAFEYAFCLARVVNFQRFGLDNGEFKFAPCSLRRILSANVKECFLCVCFSFRADFASQIQEESKRLNETR